MLYCMQCCKQTAKAQTSLAYGGGKPEAWFSCVLCCAVCFADCRHSMKLSKWQCNLPAQETSMACYGHRNRADDCWCLLGPASLNHTKISMHHHYLAGALTWSSVWKSCRGSSLNHRWRQAHSSKSNMLLKSSICKGRFSAYKRSLPATGVPHIAN